jgi:hypothetical protein
VFCQNQERPDEQVAFNFATKRSPKLGRIIAWSTCPEPVTNSLVWRNNHENLTKEKRIFDAEQVYSNTGPLDDEKNERRESVTIGYFFKTIG